MHIDLSIKLVDRSIDNIIHELTDLYTREKEHVDSVDLSVNDLGSSRTTEEVVAIITALVFFPHLSVLDLGYNELEEKSGEELARIFASIPPSVTSISLRGTLLYQKTVEELVQAVSHIPPTIKTLDIGVSGLKRMPVAALVTALKAIPAGVTELNLSENGLSEYSGAELASIFAAIPGTITTLLLKENGFDGKTCSELVQAFTALPAGVTKLNIENNSFKTKKFSSIELRRIRDAIPETVLEIICNDPDFTNIMSCGHSAEPAIARLDGLVFFPVATTLPGTSSDETAFIHAVHSVSSAEKAEETLHTPLLPGSH